MIFWLFFSFFVFECECFVLRSGFVGFRIIGAFFSFLSLWLVDFCFDLEFEIVFM